MAVPCQLFLKQTKGFYGRRNYNCHSSDKDVKILVRKQTNPIMAHEKLLFVKKIQSINLR